METLLSAHPHAEQSAAEGAAAFQAIVPSLVAEDSERPGAQIGSYKLIRQLGHGAMGVVYLAEQEQPVQRQVALTLIAATAFSTWQAKIARDAQALAERLRTDTETKYRLAKEVVDRSYQEFVGTGAG